MSRPYSPKIPSLHLDRIKVKITNIHIAGAQAFARDARIARRRAIAEFIAATMRQRKGLVALTDAGQFARQVGSRW